MKFHDQRAFTLIELLVAISLVGVLSSIAVVQFHQLSFTARDQVASSDYRNVKVAVNDALAELTGNQRFALRRFQGPGQLPHPFQHANVSSNVEVTLLYTKRIRRNRTPRTTTRLDVRHSEGQILYRYVERNGVVTEQVIQLR